MINFGEDIRSCFHVFLSSKIVLSLITVILNGNAMQCEHSVDFTFNRSNISQIHLQTIIFALIMIQQDQITSLDDRLDALRSHL